ncbi:primase alpha helix C-terminal domain-containing protein [Aerococcus urinae]|uniref:primase alpha helix C-terminal domain-containing protein n=1 Tax=Aerococcus urinae TaxID=1376 RepID=UPI0018A78B43|nr:primase alpha helix C-terminal domain-containing protein [Aerococcus urinae]
MIYTTTGVKNNQLKECPSNGSDFETLAYLCQNNIQHLEGIQSQPDGGKPVSDEIKLNDCLYFFSGQIQGSKRSDSQTLSKSLITLDIEPRANADPNSPFKYEPLDYEEAVQKLLKELEGLRYIIYPTINSQPQHARIRVILEPDQPMTKRECKATTQALIDHLEKLDLPIDPSSGDFSRLMGMPVDNGLDGDYKVITHLSGAKVPVNRPEQQANFEIKRTYSPYENGRYIGKVPRLLQEVYSGISQGGRNNFFTKAFGTLLKANVSPEYCISICQDWNQRFTQPPLSDQELVGVMKSVLSREERKRGEPVND